LGLAQEWLAPLAVVIAADRAGGRKRPFLSAIAGIGDETLALCLLQAGIGACGRDARNFREAALWIGSCLEAGAAAEGVREFDRKQALRIERSVRRATIRLKDRRKRAKHASVAARHRAARALALRGGYDRDEWPRALRLRLGKGGVDRLLELPIFELGNDDRLTMPVSAIERMDEFLVQGVVSDPLLAPSDTPPEPWTSIRQGGEHWAPRSFIREHGPTITNAVKNAIDKGRMDRVLKAVSVLKSVPWCVNEPV